MNIWDNTVVAIPEARYGNRRMNDEQRQKATITTRKIPDFVAVNG